MTVHLSQLLAILRPRHAAIVAGTCLLLAQIHPASAQSNSDIARRLARIEQVLGQLQAQAPAVGDPAMDGNIQMRVLKLEQLIEQLTGQVEEANFRLNQASNQLKTLADDLTYRVTVLEQGAPAAAGAPRAAGTQPPVALPPRAAASPDAGSGLSPLVPAPAPGASELIPRASDALSEPVTPQPQSRPRASAAPPAAASGTEGTDATGGFVLRTDAEGRPLPPDPATSNAPAVAAAPPPPPPSPQAAPNPGRVSSGQLAMAPPATVALPEGTPKAQYDFAFDLLRRNDYGRAEGAFREFLKRHPKDPLAGNAQYWLGETYYVRGDYQQAAVEFMAGYQNYPKTNKGPDNLLKLGMAMSALGQTQGACTALGRLGKDYPNAPDEVEKAAQAERAKLKCR